MRPSPPPGKVYRKDTKIIQDLRHEFYFF